ncbi:Uncharacterised protein [Chlamydia trachomatis]|nr:Uncharacterised protein [Chlamydia trachomatis]CRH48723.1 Uncharacterised protein [Chlamydia trachomatis]
MTASVGSVGFSDCVMSWLCLTMPGVDSMPVSLTFNKTFVTTLLGFQKEEEILFFVSFIISLFKSLTS